MPALPRLASLLLTDDRQQRIRLAQSGLASLLMLCCIGCIHVGVLLGVVDPSPGLTAWTSISIAGFVMVGVMIRSGLSRRFADPSMTSFQMVYAIACAAFGYVVSGAAHSLAPMTLALVLMFGMFGMTTRQVLWVALYAASLFGTVMAGCTMRWPQVYVPGVEAVQYLVMLTMLAGIVLLTKRLHGMRDRLRDRSVALQEAVAKIERLATHDDLTGLVNRRHMQQLLEDERARGQRDHQPWCVGLIDVDHVQRFTDAQGHACGAVVRRARGPRAASLIRRTDSLGRWGGEEFVLLLPRTGLADALLSLERVREHFHDHPLQVGDITLRLSFSAGVTEHQHGESVAQTLERADQLAYRAKQQGRNRVAAG